MDEEAIVFVVYVWCGGGAFRASARAVDADKTRRFDEPEDLLRYLLEAPGSAAQHGNAIPDGRDPLDAPEQP